MKKIIVLFAAFSLTMTLAHAQRGYGRNDGARGQGYSNTSTSTTYSGAVVTHRNSNYGYNNGQYRGRNRGNVRYNDNRGRHRARQQRVRMQWSNCGTFQWRLVERSYWVPARMVTTNGYCRQVPGYYDWRCTSRSRVYPNSCGPRGRRW